MINSGFASSIKLSTATEQVFFCVNLIIQIFIYTLRKKLPLFSPPMCYRRTSPRLNEATHHPVLLMHSPGENRQAAEPPTHSHTRKMKHTTETQTWDSVHFQARRLRLLADRPALPLGTGSRVFHTLEGSDSNAPETWAADSGSPHPSGGTASCGVPWGYCAPG